MDSLNRVDTESGDHNQNGTECTHIDGAINLNRVKKVVITNGLLSDCEDCKKQPPVSDLAKLKLRHSTSPPYPVQSSLWLCLKCGNQACGRFRNMHALQHFQQAFDSHCMCVDTTVWRVWCYECNHDVNVACNEELQDIMEYLRMVKSNPNKQQVATAKTADKVVMDTNFVFPPLKSSPIYTKLLSTRSQCILKFCKYIDGFTLAKASSETFLCDMEEYVRGKKITEIIDSHVHTVVIPRDFKFEPGEAIKLKELQKDFRNRLNI